MCSALPITRMAVGRLDERVMGAHPASTIAGCGQKLDEPEQVAPGSSLISDNNPDGVEGRVAPEGKEPQPGVTIDVARQSRQAVPEGGQFQPRPLRGARSPKLTRHRHPGRCPAESARRTRCC